MSVFTTVERDELVEFLRHYQTGELLAFEGISDGIENTNYFVTTDRQRMVLTLFETHTHDEMGYFLNLMAHLAEHEIPSAHPVLDTDGHYLRTLNGKPAALVARLEGKSVEHPTTEQCVLLGAILARLHIAGSEFTEHRDNGRGHDWRMHTAAKLDAHLDPDAAAMLRAEVRYQDAHRFSELPGGVIHADLFRDNVLWHAGDLSGIIDFYYACDDAWLYDVAVAVNDWCVSGDGTLDPQRVGALTGAYHGVRSITAAEAVAWPAVVRAAALRFWLSRLHDWHFPRPGEIVHRKDPTVFERILQQRIDNSEPLTV
jgi:homoserine kinase type II